MMTEQLAAAPPLWAKLCRNDVGDVTSWHSLVDHSADVAAVFEAIVAVPVVARRLAALAPTAEITPVQSARLAALVFLHDLGKANRGFRDRWRANAPMIGHIQPAVWLCMSEEFQGQLAEALPLGAIASWGGEMNPMPTVLAHHGKPVSLTSPEPLRHLWRPGPDDAPVAELAALGNAMMRWFPMAFEPGGPLLPSGEQFWHVVAGLTMLADWIGSDQRSFPFADGRCADRMGWARTEAPTILRTLGLAPVAHRETLLYPPTFRSISDWDARPAQEAVGTCEGRIVIFESETGSGKTEAALYRFARLFAAGDVDGLYFALPTRVAATAMFERVKAAVARLFNGKRQPNVVLAVPGYTKVDDASAERLPGFEVLWDDEPDAATRQARWAAEHPKRFLAGTIAVGTIDQALLGAIQVKHAHMRSAALLRHLLVVDEVHASDTYMETLLCNLLTLHAGAGGHALLLSATLGAAARSRLLRGPRGVVPTLADAESMNYPAISTDMVPIPVGHMGGGRVRSIELLLDEAISDPTAIATRALDAARAGAKVLVVRNLQRDAVNTAQALFAMTPSDDPLLFRCKGIATLHHGRFAREDRSLLDAAVNAAMGRDRPSGGLILIGTQTLEISLDIDADLMVTDLCPADVLLQRLGRLHRHDRDYRPRGFETPRVVVLCPGDISRYLARADHGLGGDYGPYADLVAVEATRRLIETNPAWSIPVMNRMLVERTTHPEAIEALAEALARHDARWMKEASKTDGRRHIERQVATHACIPWSKPFSELAFPDGEEHLATRLGTRDLIIEFGVSLIGPFGERIKALSIPSHWARGIDITADTTPVDIKQNAGNIAFNVQSTRFYYSSLGLSREDRNADRST
jgi:CRISPR-associated endonuclease/helicase Cas3